MGGSLSASIDPARIRRVGTVIGALAAMLAEGPADSTTPEPHALAKLAYSNLQAYCLALQLPPGSGHEPMLLSLIGAAIPQLSTADLESLG